MPMSSDNNLRYGKSSMNLKVVHFIWSAKSGGIERLVYTLVKKQKQNDKLNVKILIGQPKEISMNDFIGHPEVVKGFFNSGFDLSLRKILKTKNQFKYFDIIHMHAFHPATAIAAVLSGKKICYTEHGNFAFGRKQKLGQRIADYFKKIFLNKFANAITFNSNFSRSVAEERYGLQKSFRKVIYNGVPEKQHIVLNNPDNDIVEIVRGKFVLVCINRLAGFKRTDRLLTALSHIEDRKDILLLVIGIGPLEAELKAKCKSLNIESNVYFAGYRPNVYPYIALSDIFILPSENEPFGLVVIEAYSLGKPVLVFSDSGGAAELVNGIEADCILTDESEMARKIIAIKNDPNFSDTEKVELRKEYSMRFDISVMAESLNGVYRKII